ncbi:MAG: HAD family phosphatase [Prevotellaceae bacterium]|jgi:putative hydrolase of the HAD superfamily|nr:HAD family phosphatase [Prevotellaceae bacterium]
MQKSKFLQQFKPAIKNIIFDLGGVILNVDYTYTIKAFQQIGIENFEDLYSHVRQSDLFDKLDKGAISSGEFRDEIRKLAPVVDYTDEQIDKAWNSMLLDMPFERLNVLLALKSGYHTFLLSNTNEIHVPLFSGIVKNTIGKNDLSDFFEKTYYSNEIGMRKPDTEIYEFVIKQHGLQAKETLFIDDSIQNIEGARQAGLHAYHLTGRETIDKLFADLL